MLARIIADIGIAPYILRLRVTGSLRDQNALRLIQPDGELVRLVKNLPLLQSL